MNIKFIKFKKKFKKHDLWSNVNFYWKICVLIVVGVIILSLVFSYYLFVKVNKKYDTSTISESDLVETIKKARLDKALEYFDKRAERSKEILYTIPPAIDPSL
jgi:uncharacterized membrane protein SpoIIM required for sporulation